MRRTFLLAGAVLAVGLGTPAARASSRTVGRPLGLGQGTTIAGTDMVCGFGGLAGHVGIACARNGSTATANSWSFRLEEGQLVVYHLVAGNTAATRTWNEPPSQPEPTGAGGTSGFTNVGTSSPGAGFTADGTDLGCGVASFGGRVGVGCAKRDSSGAADLGSYGVELTSTTVHVLHVDASGNVTTVFTATSAAAAGRPFRITGVSSPRSVKQNGPKGTMVIHWTGRPVSPLTAHSSVASCPSGLQCTSGSATFQGPSNPVRWVAWGCTGNLTKSWTLDYWIWLTDAAGRHTQRIRQRVTCDV